MKYTLLLCALLFSVFAGAQSFKPAVKLSAGKKYVVVNTANGSMTQEVMGQSMDIPVNTITTSLLEVKNEVAGGYEMENAIKRIEFSMSMMGQEMAYDSDKKEDREGKMGAGFNNYVDKAGLFTVNNWGSIIKKATSPDGNTKSAESDGNPVAAMMDLSIDATGSPALDLFTSDKPLNIGQSFTDSTVAENNKNICVYTLTEISGGIATFSITCEGTTSLKQERQGMETVTNTTTKGTGQMMVNTATGLLVKKSLVNTISGNVEVAGMSIHMSGTMSSTITVTEQQ